MDHESTIHLNIGGISKQGLRHLLTEASVAMNAYAELLFDAPEFTLSNERYAIELTTVSLAELGLHSGASLPGIFDRAQSLGYRLCPLEVAPHLRLQLLDQPPGPYLTVASLRPRPDDMDFPAGFYLRRLDDGAWLRGYRTDDDWIWPPDFSRFVFSIP
jgi:hypothetical protein